MPLLNWGNNLDIGVHNMNEMHKMLLSIMNKLYDQHAAGADKATLSKILKELGDYTVKHFSDEEAYIKSINYPEAELHCYIHKDLLAKFSANVQEFEKGNGKISDGFFNFLKLWLSAHIQGVDKKYGDFSQKKPAA